MKRVRYRTLVWVCALLLPVTAFAQDTAEEEDLALAYGDKATVSIATGSRQSLRRAPAVASVITAEDIKAMGARDFDEVMETVPGVHVSRTAPYYFSTYQIRGVVGNPTNPQVLMLLNGIPVNDVYRGDKGEAWAGLPLDNVSRIEVIRGPGSALYGADAFAGVINIITKTASEIAGTEFGVRAGSANTSDAWVQHGGRLGAFDVAAYLRVGTTDGITETLTKDRLAAPISLAPGQIRNGHDAIDGSVDLGYQKWRLRAGYKLRDNIGVGAGVSSALDPIGTEKSERLTGDISWTDPEFARDWGLNITGSYLQYKESAHYQLFPPGSFGGAFPNGMIGEPARWQRQLRLSAFATYTGFIGHNLRIGGGHDDLDLYRTETHKNYLLTAGAPSNDLAFNGGSVVDYYARQSHMLPHRRKLDYVFLQDEWNFVRDWTLTAGVRRDVYSDFGGTTNPRLALVWDATINLTAKLLYGQAFRAPSFTEQYGINPVANGNPSLKPETVRTLEAAFSWQARRDTHLNLSFFRHRLKDVIAVSGNSFANIGRQYGEGMELEATWDVDRHLRLTGNYGRQRTIDEATQADVGLAPHDHLYLRADWRFAGGWILSPQINWVGDRKRQLGDTRAEVPDYKTVDLTLRSGRNFGRWEFAASVRNLFDAKAFEPSLGNPVLLPNDLPLSGRTLFAQASYKL